MTRSYTTYLFLTLYQVKQLAFLSILKHDENITACIDKFKVLDNVRMVETAQNLDLPLHFFEDALHFYFALVQNFDGHLVLSNFIDRH